MLYQLSIEKMNRTLFRNAKADPECDKLRRAEVVFKLLHEGSLSGETLLGNLSGFPTKIKVGHYSASYKKTVVIFKQRTPQCSKDNIGKIF